VVVVVVKDMQGDMNVDPGVRLEMHNSSGPTSFLSMLE
jgi:hypothetical protein